MECDDYEVDEMREVLKNFIAAEEDNFTEIDSCISLNLNASKCTMCLRFESSHRKKRAKKKACERLWTQKNRYATLRWKRDSFWGTWSELYELSVLKDSEEREIIDISDNNDNRREPTGRRKRAKEAKTPNVRFLYMYTFMLASVSFRVSSESLTNKFPNLIFFILKSRIKSRRVVEDDGESRRVKVPRTALRLARGIKKSIIKVLVKFGGPDEELVDIRPSAAFSSPNANGSSVPNRSQEAEAEADASSLLLTNQATGDDDVATPIKILFPTSEASSSDTIAHHEVNLPNTANTALNQHRQIESTSSLESDEAFAPEMVEEDHDLNIPNGDEDVATHHHDMNISNEPEDTATNTTDRATNQLEIDSTSLEITTTEDFPILSSLQISTDMSKLEDQIRMFKIINEINRLGTQNPQSGLQSLMLENIESITKPLENPNTATFNRINSKHAGYVYFSSGYKSFKNWKNGLMRQVKSTGPRLDNRFTQFVRYLGQDQTDPKLGDEQKGAGFLLQAIETWYPQTTKAFVMKRSQEVIRLSPEETAAVLSEVNISNNAWNGVNRLVKAFKGFYISTTRKLLNQFTERVPNAVISHFDFVYDEKKDPERIKYFAIEIPELTAMLIERELQVRVRQEKPEMFWSQGKSGIFFQTVEDRENCQSSELPKYGYETCDFKDTQSDGIYALLTSDHGKGASLGVVRFLLESSDERRERNSPDYGTISFPFYRMVCKKDPGEVVEHLAPYVNNGIDVLSKSRLVAARNKKNQLRCFLIPKKATIISVLLLEIGEAIQLCCIYIDEEGVGGCAEADATDLDDSHFDYWTAIQNFDICGIADLLFVLMAQGREGMASTRCMHCNLTIKDWKDKEKVGKEITIADLIANNRHLGCKTNPKWNICPTKWITPLLHENMGMVNKVFFHMVDWLLTNLDAPTEEEAEKRRELIDLIDQRDGCEEEFEILVAEHDLTRKALTKQNNKSKRELKKAETEGNNERVAQINIDIQNINNERESLKINKKAKEAEVDDINHTIDRSKKRIQDYVKERKKTKGSLDGRLEDVSIF